MAVVVADAIADEIFSRDLRPGVLLATEAQMIERFGIGRATLREALRLLEAEGLIAVKAGPTGGAVVAEPHPDRLARLLSILLTVSGTTLAEVIEARLLLEPELARRAAELATPTDLKNLEVVLEQGDRPPLRETAAYLDEAVELHSAVAAAAHNRALASFWFAIRQIVDGQQVGVRYPDEEVDATQRAHYRVVQAIKDRDAARAADTMRRHLRSQQKYLEQNYPQLLSARVRILDSP